MVAGMILLYECLRLQGDLKEEIIDHKLKAVITDHADSFLVKAG